MDVGAKPADPGSGEEAVNSKVAPTQILDVGGLMLTLGFSCTCTVAVAVALQLLVLVAVTVKINVSAFSLLQETGLPVLLTKVPPLLAQA